MTKPLNGYVLIPVADLHPSPNNPRERLTGIGELAASIKSVGLIQPIIVQRIPGRAGYQIVAGHRRHAAAVRLGVEAVPSIVRRDLLPDEELLTALIENGQRSGLDPIEEARALRNLSSAGYAEADIARKVGRSAQWVKERLLLLTLSQEEQEEVRAGHYSLGHALGIVRSERAQQRRSRNPVARPVGRPKGARTKPYFGDAHPLAATARAACDHRGTPKVAGVACGECWESTIRADERQHLHSASDEQGRCVLCDTTHDPDRLAEAG